MRQSVTTQFNKWGIPPTMFSTPPALGFPDLSSGTGLIYYHSAYGGVQGATKYPAQTGIFAPHNILKPAKGIVNMQAFVWWGVDFSTLTTPVATQTNVMFGAEMNLMCNGGPTFTGYDQSAFYTRYTGNTGLVDVYQDATGTVPQSRALAAIADSFQLYVPSITVDPANSLANIQSFANQVIPQCAISGHIFTPGQTICGIYRDPLQLIYKDNNGNYQRNTTTSFMNLSATTPGIAMSLGTNGMLELASTGAQPSANPLQLWRLNAGLPSAGFMSAGYDINGDGVKEVDNFAAPVTVYGIEFYIQ